MHTPLQVIHFPTPELRTTAVVVTEFGTPALHSLLENMVHTMRELRGVGLAATQVDIHQQIAVIEIKDGPLVMINPKLSNVSTTHEDDEEGCLSVPGVFGIVPRVQSLRLTAQDAEGTRYVLDAHGLLARVIQHEYDHLHGGLFFDRCTKFTAGQDKARKLGITLQNT